MAELAGARTASRVGTLRGPTAFGARASEVVARGFDVVVAAVVLALTWPALVVIAVAVRATMGSPVLFRQARAGRGGETFELVKFRTMRAAAPGDDGPDTDAERLTRLGALLRATSLDELPTLVNVVRGDMSLVGPRPLPVRYLPRYSPRHARRHEVRPGITGWAQANGRNTLTWDDQLDMDVWYVEHRSLRLDARILGGTVRSVIRREGINHEGHATRPEFPGSGIDRAEAATAAADATAAATAPAATGATTAAASSDSEPIAEPAHVHAHAS
jgi:lipopolysaccharide/colanic/teichoic acid biosynthesis glycosyltransferase